MSLLNNNLRKKRKTRGKVNIALYIHTVPLCTCNIYVKNSHKYIAWRKCMASTGRPGGAFPGMPINIKPFLVLITHLTELLQAGKEKD